MLIIGTDNDDVLHGQAGNDELRAKDGRDLLYGHAGDDVLRGGRGDDVLYGNSGNDQVSGQAGDDLLFGGAGNDTLHGNGGADILRGNTGDDLMHGDGGRDKLLGGDGADSMFGGRGNDVLLGGNGDDVLDGNEGNDRLLGQGGNDTLIFDPADLRGVDGGDGIDTLRVNGAGVAVDLTALHAIANIEIIDLKGSGDNTLVLDPAALLALSDSTDTLYVTGDAGDALQAAGDWVQRADVTEGDITYSQYTNGDARLLVQQGVDTSDLHVPLPIVAPDGQPDIKVALINGITPGASSLLDVSFIGDMNGDGYDDILVGSEYAHSVWKPEGGVGWGSIVDSFGEAYVVFGTPAGFGSIDVQTLDGSNGFIINDPSHSTFDLGQIPAGIGDINGDGYDDLAVTDRDNTYVIYGKAGGYASTLDITTLDGTDGFSIGVPPGYLSDRALSAAGDINNDGIDDFVVAFYGRHEPYLDPGAAYVVFGQAGGFGASLDLTTLDGSNGFAVQGSFGQYVDFGYSVTALGDVNGDHIDDIAIGALNHDYIPGSADHSPANAYVIFGRATTLTDPTPFAATLDVATLDGTNGFVITDNLADNTGHYVKYVESAGDMNGDGVNELIVYSDILEGPYSSYETDPYSAIIFGQTTGFGASMDLADLDGTNGFLIYTTHPSTFIGMEAAAAGDMNGDGYDDLIIVNPEYPAGTDIDAGGDAWVIYGHSGPYTPNLTLELLTSDEGFRILNGTEFTGLQHPAISGGGDFNGDGFSDLVLGLPYADVDHIDISDPSGAWHIGKEQVFLFFG